jgi:hypothetical protein
VVGKVYPKMCYSEAELSVLLSYLCLHEAEESAPRVTGERSESGQFEISNLKTEDGQPRTPLPMREPTPSSHGAGLFQTGIAGWRSA